jgi:drug/metabolite transporter (DMT)-like permease
MKLKLSNNYFALNFLGLIFTTGLILIWLGIKNSDYNIIGRSSLIVVGIILISLGSYLIRIWWKSQDESIFKSKEST